MKNFLRFSQPQPEEGDMRISYSQFSMYQSCQKKWELAYVQKLRTDSPSIHTLFGTAFHETVQEWLKCLYEVSAKSADNMDLPGLLKSKMFKLYAEQKEKLGRHFSTPKELGEFLEDGTNILEWLRKKRTAYFTTKGYELIAIEFPLYVTAFDSRPKVKLMGFIDLIIRDTVDDKLLVYDIKTSTRGWTDSDKKDPIKIAQVVLYKEYLSKQYGIEVDKIDVQFFIVRRKLFEGSMFPQKRVQEFKPASGKPTRNKVLRELQTFVESSFTQEGKYNKEREYVAYAGKSYKNCKYCEFAENDELCPMDKRIKE
jgi:hypothetical protein